MNKMTVEENKRIENNRTDQKKGLKEFFSLGEVGGYFFRKKDPSRPADINIKMMHGINKISIVVFILGILYIILKRFL